ARAKAIRSRMVPPLRENSSCRVPDQTPTRPPPAEGEGAHRGSHQTVPSLLPQPSLIASHQPIPPPIRGRLGGGNNPPLTARHFSHPPPVTPAKTGAHPEMLRA